MQRTDKVLVRISSLITGILLTAVFLVSIVSAQTSTATLQGVVDDGTGKVIANASIKLLSSSTGQEKTYTSDDNGRYTFPLIEPGTYDLLVEANGFKSYKSAGLVLQVGQSAEINVSLTVGLETQVVTVEGGTLQLDDTTGSLGGVIEQRRIESLPLNGRNVLQLATLEAGVAGSSVTRSANPSTSQSATFSVSGGRFLSNDILFDGLTVTQKADNLPAFRPSPDSIQEFRISTNSFNAEFGRTGGGAVSFITRQGEKDFHGTLWEYFRNDALDANNFFANRNGTGKQKLRYNQYGGNFGGPIVLPGFGEGVPFLSKPKNLFFFVNYEALRIRSATTQFGTVPTARMRNGDFGELLGARLFSSANNCTGTVATTMTQMTNLPCLVTNTSGATVPAQVGMIYQIVGATRRAFTGNIIPLANQNPVGRAIINSYPLPNATSVINPANATLGFNYFTNGTTANSDNQIVARFDYGFAKNHQLYFRTITESNTQTDDGTFPGLVSSRANSSDVNLKPASLALDYVISNFFSQNAVLKLNGGWTRFDRNNRTNSNGFDPATLGFPAYIGNTNGENGMVFPSFTNTNYSSLGPMRNMGNTGNTQDTFSFTGDLNYVVGNHSLKTGSNFRYYTIYSNRPDDPAGNFTFTRANTARTANDTISGDTIASLLIGSPNAGRLAISPQPAILSKYISFYLQDDWKVNKRLTLNLGLRYEIDYPNTDRYGLLTNFRSENNFPVSNITIPGTSITGVALPAGIAGLTVPLRGQYTPVNETNDSNGEQQNRDLNNFGPRLGFAYRLTQKTVLRGGAGLFYSSNTGGGFSNSAIGYAGLVETPFVPGTNVTLSNPFPNGVATQPILNQYFGYGQNLVARLRDVRQPEIWQWNLSAQRELPGKFFVQTSYVGSSGSFLLSGSNQLNQLTPQNLALGTTVLETMIANPFLTLPVDQRPPASSILGAANIPLRQLLRPYPQFGNVQSLFGNEAHSTYHAGLFSLQRRVSGDLGLQVSYTFSKLIDDISAIQSTAIGVQIPDYQNIYDRRADKSLSTLDFRHVFSANVTYDLPFGRKKLFFKEGVMSRILGGFQLNVITQFQNGAPLAITQALNAALTGLGYNAAQRPNLIGDPALPSDLQTIDRWFNTTISLTDPGAFAAVSNYQFGNTPRTLGSVRGPKFFGTNMGLHRTFTFQERFKAQFRAEAFNIFNRTNFGLPGTTFGGAGFGQILTAEDARSIQLAVRLSF